VTPSVAAPGVTHPSDATECSDAKSISPRRRRYKQRASLSSGVCGFADRQPGSVYSSLHCSMLAQGTVESSSIISEDPFTRLVQRLLRNKCTVIDGTDEDAVAMTTLNGDERSPNGTTKLFEVTMDDDSAAAAGAAGCVRVVHVHKNDDEPMVSGVRDRHALESPAFAPTTRLECK